jgi:hypothetical protein
MAEKAASEVSRPASVWRRAAVYAWIALLISNAAYFGKWSAVLDPLDPAVSYYRAELPRAALYLSFFGSLALLALLVYAAILVAIRRRWISESSLFAVTAAVVVLRLMTMFEWIRADKYRLVIAAVLCTVLLAVIARRVGDLRKIAAFVLFFFSVLSCVQAASFLWRYTGSWSAVQAVGGRAAKIAPKTGARPHIVWMVFDELDYELTTSLRPSSVQMNEFDRLRGESLFATDSHSPATRTAVAFPALFTGRRIHDVRPNGPDDLSLSFGPGQRPVSWREQPSIFSVARQSGFNSSLVGWHHPYCRVFSETLADCFWTPNLDAFDSLRREFAVGQQGVGIMLPARDALPVRRQYELVTHEQQREYRRTLEHALTVVANPDFHLVMLHWLVPHPPGIYDRYRNALEHRPGSNYFDNLELVDFTLGSVRRALEKAGLWEDTTLIVTGDHPLRTHTWADRPVWTTEEAQLSAKRQHPRVPFLVKIARQADPLLYSAPFDTVLAHSLILQWLEGKQSTVRQVASFIDSNRNTFPVHVPGPDESGH